MATKFLRLICRLRRKHTYREFKRRGMGWEMVCLFCGDYYDA